MVYIHLICAVHCIAHLSARLAQPLTALAYSPADTQPRQVPELPDTLLPKILYFSSLSRTSNPNFPFPVFSLQAQGSPSEGHTRARGFRDATEEEDQTSPTGEQDQLQSFWYVPSLLLLLLALASHTTRS